jgi:hypothetical protein
VFPVFRAVLNASAAASAISTLFVLAVLSILLVVLCITVPVGTVALSGPDGALVPSFALCS